MQALDHVVFNTQDRMDEVVALFGRLGFIVTPRGHHTLGSINHLVVLGTDYLELLGYPPGQPPAQRPELQAQPLGLLATVFATADADATRATLISRGLAPRPVQSFSRPVDLGNGVSKDAAFRVTRLEPDAVPGTWCYYCQHLTPELVWRPAWQLHPNGATAIAALDIAVPSLAAALPIYHHALMSDDAKTVGGSGSHANLKLHGSALNICQQPGTAHTRGVTIRVASLDTVRRLIDKARIAYTMVNGVIVINPDATLGVTIQLSAQAP